MFVAYEIESADKFFHNHHTVCQPQKMNFALPWGRVKNRWFRTYLI